MLPSAQTSIVVKFGSTASKSAADGTDAAGPFRRSIANLTGAI
jgi:hypothetical protein